MNQMAGNFSSLLDDIHDTIVFQLRELPLLCSRGGFNLRSRNGRGVQL